MNEQKPDNMMLARVVKDYLATRKRALDAMTAQEKKDLVWRTYEVINANYINGHGAPPYIRPGLNQITITRPVTLRDGGWEQNFGWDKLIEAVMVAAPVALDSFIEDKMKQLKRG